MISKRGRLLPTLLTAVLGASALLGAGCEFSCSVGKKIDAEKLEGKIRANFADQGGVIKGVTCPTDVKLEKGLKFTCDVIAENGDLLKIEFDQTDSKGNVQLAVADELVVMSKVRTGIQGMIGKNEVAAKAGYKDVACPPDKKAVKDGHFECTASTADRTLVIGVDETDAKGNVVYGFARVEVAPKSLADELVGLLAEKKVVATVDCGSDPVKLTDKKLVTCKGENDKGQAATIEIMPAGNLGAFQWRVQ